MMTIVLSPLVYFCFESCHESRMKKGFDGLGRCESASRCGALWEVVREHKVKAESRRPRAIARGEVDKQLVWSKSLANAGEY
jgi:hypothetical protein